MAQNFLEMTLKRDMGKADAGHSQLRSFLVGGSLNLFREKAAKPLARHVKFKDDGTVEGAPDGICFWDIRDKQLVLLNKGRKLVSTFDTAGMVEKVPPDARIVEVGKGGKDFRYVFRMPRSAAVGRQQLSTDSGFVIPRNPNMAVPLTTPTREQLIASVLKDPKVRNLKERISAMDPGLSVYIGREMKGYTHNKVGGPADLLCFPKTVEQFQGLVKFAIENGVPYTVLGRGSNVIVRDGGIRGLVIMTTGLNRLALEGGIFTAGAGADFIEASYFLLEHGLSSLEWASGIPGTVGGAVFMNAGTNVSDVRATIRTVKFLDHRGAVREFAKDEIAWGKRYTTFQDHPNWVILEASFDTNPAEKDELSKKMLATVQVRENHFPLESPNHGSTFKWWRAPRLIMQAGLTGYQIGGVQISTKQPGFFVNVDQATASDYEALINYAIAKVYEYSGFLLEPEVEVIGERPHRYERYTLESPVTDLEKKAAGRQA